MQSRKEKASMWLKENGAWVQRGLALIWGENEGGKKRGQNVIREVGRKQEGGAVCHSLTCDDAIHQCKDSKVQADKQMAK